MRFSIKLKLGLAFATMTLLLVAIAVYSSISLGHLNDAANAMTEGPVKRLQLALETNVAAVEAARAQKDALISDGEAEANFYKESSTHLDTMFSHTQDGLAIASAEGKPLWEKLISLGQTFRQRSNDLQALEAKGDHAGAAALSDGELSDLSNQMTDVIGKLVDVQKRALAATDAANDQLYADTWMVLAIVSVIAFVIALGSALWITLGINRGLTKVADIAKAVALGDLNKTVEVKTNDEIKDLIDIVNVMTSNLRDTAAVADRIAIGDLSVTVKPLSDKDVLGLAMQSMVANLRATSDIATEISNGDLMVTPKPLSDKDVLGLALEQMVERLRGVVADAISASENVSAGSQELSASSEQVSQGATEQAASAEEASASMEQMA
ncbi:methyl-accepting chemotaxis protein, partial [Rhizobium mayense]